MSIKRTYALGIEFPSEGFVQDSIEAHFLKLGFDINADGLVDLVCSHPKTGERWHIEAKGKTAEPGLDFRTCLGQLVQRMRDRDTRYAIALPEIPEYVSQIDAISKWVTQALRIHWLMVSPDRSVIVKSPSSNAQPDA